MSDITAPVGRRTGMVAFWVTHTHMEIWCQPTASKRLSTHNPVRRLAASAATRLTKSTLHGSDKAQENRDRNEDATHTHASLPEESTSRWIVLSLNLQHTFPIETKANEPKLRQTPMPSPL